MADIRFKDLDIAPDITDLSFFIGYIDNGDDTFTDYKFTPAQVIANVLASTRKLITASATAVTLTDSWFTGKAVQELIMNGQTYLVGVDFTQTSNVITGIDISFFTGQKILARL